MNQKIKKYLSIISNLGVVLLLILFLEGKLIFWGIFGYLLIWGIIVIARLIKGGYLLTASRTLESTIWGKPLDKANWKEGELKNTKVKVVWRKKKNEKKK